MKELGYAQVPMVARGDFVYLGTSDIRNPIFYKADRFDLLECGYDRYAATVFPAPEKGKAPEYPSSSYTWAVFEERGTKKRIAVFSTHLVARVNHADNTEEQRAKPQSEYHLESVTQLADKMQMISDKYGCGVIASGDYNHSDKSAA